MLFETFILTYIAASIILLAYAVNLIYLSIVSNKKQYAAIKRRGYPKVTVQLPIYNEYFVAKRLIDAVCCFDYPKERLQIQVLDDSDDETNAVVDAAAAFHRGSGVDIRVLRRKDRIGFKAGALQYGLTEADGDFIAIFDSDFLPPKDFLKKTLPYFDSDDVGLVQARWGHINEMDSILTKAQTLSLNTQFLIEHPARDIKGWLLNFNGTAGVFRKEAILDSGGWSSETLTEDLDLSIRAQMRGWRFKYAKDVVCPAELPSSVTAYTRQQERWAVGTIQCAKKHLAEIWRGDESILWKTQATFVLTRHLIYPLMLIQILLLYPLMTYQVSLLPFFSLFCLLILGPVAYLRVLDVIDGGFWKKLGYYGHMVTVGTGNVVVGTRSMISGFFKKEGVFKRTPKYGFTKTIRKRYYVPVQLDFFLEAWLAAYTLFCAYYAVTFGYGLLAPYLMSFSIGLTYRIWLYNRQGFAWV